MNSKELADKSSLKELIDRVSILADTKDFQTQGQLFSENVVSETYAGGTAILKLKGRKEMAEAFSNFLKDFETVYHFNGQQVVSIYGDKAIGTCYCQLTTESYSNKKKMSGMKLNGQLV